MDDSTGNSGDQTHVFTNCKFNNNNVDNICEYDIHGQHNSQITLTDCDLGDSTFSGKEYLDFGRGLGAGSIFGEGSLAVIISVANGLRGGMTAFDASLTLLLNLEPCENDPYFPACYCNVCVTLVSAIVFWDSPLFAPSVGVAAATSGFQRSNREEGLHRCIIMIVFLIKSTAFYRQMWHNNEVQQNGILPISQQ